MTPDLAGRTGPRLADLAARIEALEQAAALVTQHGPNREAESAAAVAAGVRSRLELGLDVTMVGLVGPTGVGKSSLFNTIVGEPLASVSLLRPTNARAVGCAFGSAQSDAFDWLGVEDRHVRDAPPGWTGLVLVDAPDMDSVEQSHRLEVERLVELLDVVLWVVDIEKYADLSVHERYLRDMAGRGRLSRTLVNRVDLLDPSDSLLLTGDMTALLEEVGFDAPDPIPVSAKSLEGLDDLKALLAETVSPQTPVAAAGQRLETAARRLAPRVDDVALSDDLRQRCIDAVGRASGVHTSDRAAFIELRRADARRQVGWPPKVWLGPRSGPAAAAPAELDQSIGAGASHDAAQATIEVLAADVAAQLEEPWASIVFDTSEEATSSLLDRSAPRVARSLSTGEAAPWWGRVRIVQRVLVVLVVLAAAWSAVGLVTGTGGALGIVAPLALAVLAAVLGAVLGAVAGRAVDRQLHGQAAEWRHGASVAAERTFDRMVVAPIQVVLDERAEVARLCRVVTDGARPAPGRRSS